MTETTPSVSWAEANQTYLVAEFTRLKDRLQSLPTTLAEASVAEAVAQLEAPSTLDLLTRLFGLSPFERQILLLCAGCEMDAQLAALCAESHGSSRHPFATFGLALATLDEPHWSALTPARPLRRLRLLELEPGRGLTTASLHLDERVLHFLAGAHLPGIASVDHRIQSFLSPSSVPGWIADEHKAIAAQLTSMLEEVTPGQPPILHLCGDDPHGQEDVASLTAQSTGRVLFVLRPENLPSSTRELEQCVTLWEREALLQSAALLLPCPTGELSLALSFLAERLTGVIFLSSPDPIPLHRPFLRFEIHKPPPLEQRRLWQRSLGRSAGDEGLQTALDDLANHFRLSARSIASTAATPSASGGSIAPGELWCACRALARPRLENLARRIVSSVTWDDLILPAPQMQMLRRLASQVRFRTQVHEQWGLSHRGRRGLGISALFTGESGTGKTLAAEVLAAELRLDIYRIDLSAVVSKYIGETEKNLRLVFDAAEEGGVLLLFDEADALFGKRAEVKDGNNHYANIQVGYLLQRMEVYQGLAVLTTNLKSSMDKAFQRRLRFTIHFPFPDAMQREAIWRRAFPLETPTQGLDPVKLAQLNIPGGNIRNIALNAAFLAAQSGSPVRMSHLLDAAHLEASKIERSLSAAELRGWL